MSRLFLPNLLTDQTYLDPHPLQKIFPVHPVQGMFLSRLAEELGVWILENAGTKQMDFVVLPYELPSIVRNLASAHGVRLPDVLKVRSHPGHAQEFATELASLLEGYPNISVVECAGWGLAEEKLKSLLKSREVKVYPSGWADANIGMEVSSDFFSLSRELNSKMYLPQIAELLNLCFPASKAVVAGDILDIAPSANFIFKSEFSSGGSGILNPDDSTRRMLARALREDDELKNSVWLMQKRIAVKREFSAVVWPNVVSPEKNSLDVSLLEVEYDKTGLSRTHRSLHPGETNLCTRLYEVAKLIAEFLVERGWLGPFGFDSILDDTGNLYEVTDLNVRMTKGHFLLAAIKALGYEQHDWLIERVRVPRSPFPSELELHQYSPSAKVLSCGGALESDLASRSVCEWTELKMTDRIEASHENE